MVRVAQDALVVVPRAEDHGTFLATGLIDKLFQRCLSSLATLAARQAPLAFKLV